MEYEILGAEEVKELKIYWKIHLYEYLNHQEYNGYSVRESDSEPETRGSDTRISKWLPRGKWSII